VPPTFESGPTEAEVTEGGTVQLTCISSGIPKPIITWEKKKKALPPMSRTNIEVSESRNISTRVYTVSK